MTASKTQRRAKARTHWARRLARYAGYTLFVVSIPAGRTQAVTEAGARVLECSRRMARKVIIGGGTIVWDAPITNVRIIDRALRKAGAVTSIVVAKEARP
jgi:hypothetical protein